MMLLHALAASGILEVAIGLGGTDGSVISTNMMTVNVKEAINILLVSAKQIYTYEQCFCHIMFELFM